MPTITCPQCSQVSEFEALHRSADEFCTDCDYPLFWAMASTPAPDDDGGDASLRRLPGTAGRRTVATRACGTCGELNPITAQTCSRCGSDMNPPAAVAPTLAPLPPPPPEPEPVPDPSMLPIWVLTTVLGLLVISIVTLLVV